MLINYWSDLGSRLARWVGDLAGPVGTPTWTTPNQIVHDQPLALLRRFDTDRHGTPWLVINPNAGHHSMIGDYAPGQSLVETLLANDPDSPVFAVEWLPATTETKHSGIDEYVLALDRMVGAARRLGDAPRVRLVGLCQGGWLSTLLTALLPEVVENLILAGAPIDFRAGDGKIERAMESLGLPWYQWLVRTSGGVMPGRHMVSSWKLMNPFERFVEDPSHLWQNLDNDTFMERHRRFRNWYEWTQDLPGRFYLQVVEELFHDNRLVQGTFRSLGQRVDLGDIRCPVSTIAGARDDITLPEQLQAIGDHVASARVRHRIVDAGHIGLFIQRDAVEQTWPEVIREALQDARDEWAGDPCPTVLAPTLEEMGFGPLGLETLEIDPVLRVMGETPPDPGALRSWAEQIGRDRLRRQGQRPAA